MRNHLAGEGQSVYQNALPLYNNRIDLCHIDAEGADFADKMVRGIFSRSLDLQTAGTPLTAKKLAHLHFETRNTERIQGQQTLAVGYPLLLFSEAEKLTVAPLFISSVVLTPDRYNPDLWHFRSPASVFTEVNEDLLDYLDKELYYTGTEEIRQMVGKKLINIPTLLALNDRLCAETGLTPYGSPEATVPAPGVDVIGELPEDGGLQWSAVLGIFPAQQIGGTVFPTEELQEILKPRTVSLPDDFLPFGLLPLNPAQASAAHAVHTQRATIIEGGNNSGKTHLLTYLLTNILLNRKKCLVVSDSAASLKKAQQRLTAAGVLQHHFLLNDTRREKAALSELMRSAAQDKPQTDDPQTAEYEMLLGQTERLHRRLSARYAAVREAVFGTESRAELTGRKLRSGKNADGKLLNTKLRAEDFDFHPEEFRNLREDIYLSEILFEKVKTLEHPLTVLHPHIFTQRSAEEAELYVRDKCRAFLAEAEALQKKFIKTQTVYSAKLQEYYDLYYREFNFRVRGLQEKITDNQRLYGKPFVTAGNAALRVKSLFSERSRAMREAREDIQDDWQSFRRAFAEKAYFDFNFTSAPQRFSVTDVRLHLDGFAEALNYWRGTIPAIITDDVQRLSVKNAHPSLKFTDRLAAVENALADLIERLNAAELYAQPFDDKMLTLAMRQKNCEQIIGKLEFTLRNLSDFSHFYKWQRNYLSLSPLSKKVTTALIKTKPDNRKEAFGAWYFDQALRTRRSEAMPTDDKALYKYGRMHRKIAGKLPTCLAQRQQTKVRETLRRFRQTNRRDFDLLFTKAGVKKTAAAPFSDFAAEYTDIISTVFPILFTSLRAAENLTAGREDYFDYIFFIESGNLTTEDAAGIAPAGKRVALLTDPYFAEENDFADFLRYLDTPIVRLERKAQNVLLQHTAPFARYETRTQVLHTEGRFQNKVGINEAEIQQLTQLLLETEPMRNRTLPAIGIVTFTKAQRDATAAHLLKIKGANNAAAEKIYQLERNGLGVYFAEEVIGQKFDILIVSLTFGSSSKTGRPGKKAGYLTSSGGLRSIKYLISRQLQKTYILNSMPEESLEQFLESTEKNGAYYLAHLLTYAEATAREDYERAAVHHAALWEAEITEPQSSIFRQEVRTVLQQFFKKGRILQRFKTENDLEIPLYVAPQNAEQAGRWLQPDGFLADTPQTSFLWELQQRLLLEEHNILLTPLWSADWAKDAEKAAGKTAAVIIRGDN